MLGGEPFEHVNQQGLLKLVERVREVYPNKDIWAYSGFLFDRDIVDKMTKSFVETSKLLSYIDVLIDGKFEEELKNPSLAFRGSSNQRVIDVPKSLKMGKVCEIEIESEKKVLC